MSVTVRNARDQDGYDQNDDGGRKGHFGGSRGGRDFGERSGGFSNNGGFRGKENIN